MGTRDWYLMHYSNPSVTGGRKKTHTHQPYPHVKPTYSAKAQYMEDVDTSLPLYKKGKKYIQEVIGTFLYYSHCVDSTMLPALGSLAMQQANPTQNTKK
jgi:hypothetical protein